MPIDPPRLDDLRYERIRDMLISRIPIHAPEWTDHNDSDPGITMIQLFAWLADQLGYRLNRVPEVNYIQFLRMLGERLRPAEAATTRLSFLLTAPERRNAFVIRAGTRAMARGAEPVTLETAADLDVVPAQLAGLVCTRGDDLRRLAAAGESEPSESETAEWIDARFTVLWDGKRPTLQNLPSMPLPLERPADHRELWLPLIFQADRSPAAGFLGQRVTLTVQLDDDEQPDPEAHVLCGEEVLGREALPRVTYRWYRPARTPGGKGTWELLRVLADTTADWTRSGELRFDVPVEMGPVPDAEWVDVRAASGGAGSGFAPPSEPAPPEPHPMTVGAIRSADSTLRSELAVPVTGWLNVRLPEPAEGEVAPALRQISFNVVGAVHATTVRSELVGRGDGKPGQTAQLAHGNVLADTLELVVRDPTDGLMHRWERVDDLHAVDPDARVYVLDPEAGRLTFGDGRHGRPPALGQEIVAQRYRHGGGRIGELPPASVKTSDAAADEVTNIVACSGGRAAETLAEALERAPRDLKVMKRAVTRSDFEHLTLQTPGMRVGRAVIVPLRRPFADPVARGPGLDHDRVAPGALSVIVVPDASGPHPTPTEGELRKVCRWLDEHRLLTTEVHVVSPQYVRLFGWRIAVRPGPGYSRTLLQLAVAERLEQRLHVLRGGPNGAGFPFGAVLHHADLVAEVLRVDGVERVTSLVASADGRAADSADHATPDWREERGEVQTLTACPEAPDETESIQLRPDEALFVDSSDLIVTVAEEVA